MGTELARLQAELERVGDERRALEETASARIAALESDLAAANAELAQLTAARDEAAAAFPPGDDPEASNELALLQDEYEALRTEYIMINNELTDRNTDLQQLRNEKDAAEEAAAEEIAALKATVLRLMVSGHEGPHSASDQSAPTTPPHAVQADRSHAASDPAIKELAALFTQTDSETPPPKNEADVARKGPVSFHLDNSLMAIPCLSADDVIELRVSFNTIEMSSNGANPQNCSAYICGLERNGSRQIYLALYQIKSRRALIYVPSQQPQNLDDYGRIMQDAISFADVSGFIINLETLGGRPKDRLKVLQKIPVLDRL